MVRTPIRIPMFLKHHTARWGLWLLAAAACGFAHEPSVAPLENRFPSTPLAPPLDITGGFCEYRVGHFHAGLDLGTGRVVGKPVLAPADGWIERVRTSGVGYGRSLYLKTTDHRLLQFGHLDAFVDPIDRYVRARQDSAGQYEQDLWPEAGQFRFKAGDRIAWTGESGAGGPHLHFEVRRGDMAYHPLRAGLAAPDSSGPTLAALTLEPLDDSSTVAGGAAPFTLRLGAAAETLAVRGRVRAIVAARDGVWRGVDRMVPWSVAMTWEGERVECRFDSVSWATDMPEGAYVYDAGRVIGEKGLVLWAPARFRPRVLVTSAPLSRDAGTIHVRPGDRPRALELEARDLGGNSFRQTVVLTAAARSAPRGTVPVGRTGIDRLEFAALPGHALRISDRGAPAGSRNVRITVTSSGRERTATPGAGGWTVVATPGIGRPMWAEEVAVRGEDAQGAPWTHSLLGVATTVTPGESSYAEHHGRRLEFPPGAAFEPGVVLFHPSGTPAASGELTPLTVAFNAEPASLPLRSPARLTLPLEGVGTRNVGVYRYGDDGWEWVSATLDSARGNAVFESRRLGRFALLRDRVAPRVALTPAPRRPRGRPAYSRWAIEARVTEDGSGLDGRASYVMVDGKRMATEWDSEGRILRWRPRTPPARGRHRLVVVATDRAGNITRTPGSFVLD